MVSRADAVVLGSDTRSVAVQAADRWIFVFMAALFFATTLVGFVPDSIIKLSAIEAGQRPPFPPILHVHAILMGMWLLLLLTQASLMATGHRALHQRLGLVSLALAPAMVIAGVVLVPTMFGQVWSFLASAPPGVDPAAIAETKALLSNILLGQIRVGILFPVFVAWALWVRRRDPDTHKRLMILATVLPLPAAIDRITWLPTTLPASPASPDLYMLLWVLPMFVYDVARHGRIQRAYVIWIVVALPLTIALHSLWGSPWWLETAPKLLGVEPW